LIQIAAVEPQDVEAIASLMEEMAEFYGEDQTEPLDDRICQIKEALFGDPPAAHALLARNDHGSVAFAAYSFLWPAEGLTRSLYLKELYVRQDSRRAGVGELLMNRLFEIATETNCSRVEWTTDQSNPSAQAFYRSLGVPPMTSKIFYRVDDFQAHRKPHRLA
jgi:GNAT superfamily N-acetyltransferase